MKNVFLKNEERISSLNNDNILNSNQIENSLNQMTSNKRNIQLISNSQFPSDFFYSKGEPQTHNIQKDSYKKHIEDIDSFKISNNRKIHIIPKTKPYHEEDPKTQFNEKDIISFKYDCNYEEDKEMIDLLSGKDNTKIESNSNNNAALIQTLRQKKKILKKCEIIPEVNESQYMRTRTSQFSTEENEHNSNIRHNQFIKSRGDINKFNRNIKMKELNSIESMLTSSKQKDKIAIEAIPRESSASLCKVNYNSDLINKESQSTRSNSSTFRNMNKNKLLTLGLNTPEINFCPYEKQIGPLQSTFNSIMTLVNDKDLKEDVTIKQKLKQIMQNISDVKLAIAHKKQRRNNINSAPSNTTNNTPSLTKTKRIKKLKLINDNITDIIQNTNPTNRIEGNGIHYNNYRNNIKKGIATQRRNQSTAPVKVFSQSKK